MVLKLYNKFIRFVLSPEKYARRIGVKIGEGCYVSTKTFGSEPYLIEIGNNVRIANLVRFYTHGGLWPYRKIHKNIQVYGKIKVGNNVYIGDGCKILPGVTIEDNCLIGAGCVVSKSIQAGSVVAGNPIRYITNIDNYLAKMKSKDIGQDLKQAHNKKEFLLNLTDDEFVKKSFLSI